MIDQATALRKKAGGENATGLKNTRVIAIASGKGGVGKSNVTANLALDLQERGKKVLILDGDLGTANIDVLFNVTPKYNLSHVLKGRCKLEEALVKGPGGVHILPGTSGMEDLVNISSTEVSILLQAFTRMEKDFDLLLIDIGAGIHRSVINFIQACDETLIVLTPEPTAVMDAYSLIKILSNHRYKKKIRLIINQVDSQSEGEKLAERMKRVIDKYLTLDLDVLGYIPEDGRVRQAVKEQSPFLMLYPDSKAGRAVKGIGASLLNEDDETGFRGMKGFVYRLIGVFNRN